MASSLRGITLTDISYLGNPLTLVSGECFAVPCSRVASRQTSPTRESKVCRSDVDDKPPLLPQEPGSAVPLGFHILNYSVCREFRGCTTRAHVARIISPSFALRPTAGARLTLPSQLTALEQASVPGSGHFGSGASKSSQARCALVRLDLLVLPLDGLQ
jgi:hypothetical protein